MTFARLSVSGAFHTPEMEPVSAPFRLQLAARRTERPHGTWVSNVSGRIVTDEEALSPDYWVRHLVSPVQFMRGMRTLREQGCNAFLEVGPGGSLTQLGQACLQDSGSSWISSLRKGRPAWRSLLEAAAAVYAAGVDLDWHGVHRDQPRSKALLPTYPFERRRYWLEPSASASTAGQAAVAEPSQQENWTQWFYQTDWRVAPGFERVVDPDASRHARLTLIGGDDRLAARLSAAGLTCTAINADLPRIPAADREQSTSCLVFLAAAGPAPPADASAADVEAATCGLCGRLAGWIRALLRYEAPARPSLWIVTRGVRRRQGSRSDRRHGVPLPGRRQPSSRLLGISEARRRRCDRGSAGSLAGGRLLRSRSGGRRQDILAQRSLLDRDRLL